MQTICITGVSSGIGLASAKAAIKSGFQVIGTVRSHEDSIAISGQLGQNFIPLILDVTSDIQIEKEIQRLKTLLPNLKLKCLINNAGVAVPGPLEEVGTENFIRQMDINVTGVLRTTNAFLPFLKRCKNNPKIINISSISGLISTPMNGPYCISKHALESMNDIYRRELKMFDIDVISFQPGPIKTKIWRKNLGKLDRFKNGEYGSILKNADKVILNSEKKALDVKKASDLILKIINRNKNKTHYILHQFPFMISFVSNWIPNRWLDRIIWKNMNQSKSRNLRGI